MPMLVKGYSSGGLVVNVQYGIILKGYIARCIF